jgi:hypothetical protein
LPAGCRPGEPGNAENRVLKRVGGKLDFMKKLFVLLFISTFFLGTLTSQVTVEAFPMEPQSGQYNYFGVRVTLPQTYGADVVVTGYIYDDGSPDTNHPFSLTVTSGNLTAETADNFYQTSPAENAAAEISTIGTTYAGVTIIFEVTDNILKFASTSDAIAVLDQLDEDYEDNYNYYDSQIDTSQSVEVLDSIDEANEFYPRITYRNFEDLFPGFVSKRSQIEEIESDWLYNDLSGTHPASVDLTYDDATNTICNSNYSFKIGNDVYQLTSSGLYINTVLQDNTKVKNMHDGIFLNDMLQNSDFFFSGPFASMNESIAINEKLQDPMTVCKSNKKSYKSPAYKYDNNTKMFELEVAIHSVGFRSSVKAKVVHYKLKNNGHWKRSREKMAAWVGGNTYGGSCASYGTVNLREPSTGFQKREEKKSVVHTSSPVIWKTYSGEISGSFDSPNHYSTWILYF